MTSAMVATGSDGVTTRIFGTNEIKRRQAMEAIRASKADEETELWLRRMRDEAYVDFKS